MLTDGHPFRSSSPSTDSGYHCQNKRDSHLKSHSVQKDKNLPSVPKTRMPGVAMSPKELNSQRTQSDRLKTQGSNSLKFSIDSLLTPKEDSSSRDIKNPEEASSVRKNTQQRLSDGISSQQPLTEHLLQSHQFSHHYNPSSYPSSLLHGMNFHLLSSHERNMLDTFFPGRGNLLNSQASSFPPAGKSPQKKQRPKRFQCPHCQVSFSNNGQLRGHVRIHTGMP
jgi:hypothetical protein